MGWLFGKKSNSKEKLQELLAQKPVILDVRTQREWDSGSLPGATHIPLQELPQRWEEIKALNKPVITYCEMGGRSAKAAKILTKNGMEAVNGGGWRSLKKLL